MNLRDVILYECIFYIQIYSLPALLAYKATEGLNEVFSKGVITDRQDEEISKTYY